MIFLSMKFVLWFFVIRHFLIDVAKEQRNRFDMVRLDLTNAFKRYKGVSTHCFLWSIVLLNMHALCSYIFKIPRWPGKLLVKRKSDMLNMLRRSASDDRDADPKVWFSQLICEKEQTWAWSPVHEPITAKEHVAKCHFLGVSFSKIKNQHHCIAMPKTPLTAFIISFSCSSCYLLCKHLSNTPTSARQYDSSTTTTTAINRPTCNRNLRSIRTTR